MVDELFMMKQPTVSRTLSFEEVEDILIYFSGSILEKNREEDVFWDLAKNVIARLGFVDCVIYTLDQRTGKLVQRAAYGPKNPRHNDILKPLEIFLGEGITGYVAKTGIAERIADTRIDSRYVMDDEPRMSELTVPIAIKDKVLGVIDCEHPSKDFFTEQHLRIVKAVASICAIKLSHLEALRAVQQKEAKLLLAKNEMADLKIKAIRAQMNPHFVFNALNAVQHYITSNDKKNALRFLSAFSKLVRLYLKHVEDDTISLFQEIDIIDQYLKLQKLRYDGMFEYEIHHEGFDNGLMHVPALIIQLMIEEGVENLAKNKVAGKMEINIQAPNEKHVVVTVDISISGKGKAKLESRYSNEVTNWSDHIQWLRKIKKYTIKTKKEVIRSKGVVHHITRVTLPCL
jgi:putative methionine-R-sulfoxide reductase with GAF domain